MIELLKDPDTIPFTNGNTIDLNSLKNQIDRRILKITNLIQNLPDHQSPQVEIKKQPLRGVVLQNQQTQTQKEDSRCLSIQDNVLKPKKSNNIANIKQQKNHSKKPSFLSNQTINTKKSGCQSKPHSKQKQNMKNKNSKVKIFDELAPIQISQNMKFTFQQKPEVQSNSASSTEKKNLMASQDDKIFSSLDFALQISSIKMIDSIVEVEDGNKFRSAVQAKRRTNNYQFSISSFEQQSESRCKAQPVSKRLPSQRKMRNFDKQLVLPSPEKRIIFSDECRDKMLSQIQKMIPKKRKQPTDNKLRTNIIKKIEEKYGSYYQNI